MGYIKLTRRLCFRLAQGMNFLPGLPEQLGVPSGLRQGLISILSSFFTVQFCERPRILTGMTRRVIPLSLSLTCPCRPRPLRPSLATFHASPLQALLHPMPSRHCHLHRYWTTRSHLHQHSPHPLPLPTAHRARNLLKSQNTQRGPRRTFDARGAQMPNEPLRG
jgi:hypothetical protein